MVDFVTGNSYFYGSSRGLYPYFVDTEGQNHYLECDARLVNKAGINKPFISEIWEPRRDTECKCVSTEPLIFECEYVCLADVDKRESEILNVVHSSLTELTKNRVTLEQAYIVRNIFSWPIDNQGRAFDKETFTQFLIDTINKSILQIYDGSSRGYSDHIADSGILLSMLFGIKVNKIVSVLVNKGVKVAARKGEHELELFVEGVPYCDYVSEVLEIYKTDRLSNIFRNAEG